MAAGDKLLLEDGATDFLLLEDDGTGPPPTVTDVLLLEEAGGGATHPVNPFGHPLRGPFAGPIGF